MGHFEDILKIREGLSLSEEEFDQFLVTCGNSPFWKILCRKIADESFRNTLESFIRESLREASDWKDPEEFYEHDASLAFFLYVFCLYTKRSVTDFIDLDTGWLDSTYWTQEMISYLIYPEEMNWRLKYTGLYLIEIGIKTLALWLACFLSGFTSVFPFLCFFLGLALDVQFQRKSDPLSSYSKKYLRRYVSWNIIFPIVAFLLVLPFLL